MSDLLAVCLGTLPAVTDSRADEIEGLPDGFDRWVFQVVVRTVRALPPGEEATALWRPLLDLPIPAHEWVEQFLWHWFPDRPLEAEERETFFAHWAAMIRHAVAHPAWDPATANQHDLGDMVMELLGFHFGMETVAGNDAYASLFQRYGDEFDRAAARWIAIPRVTHGFARFLIRPAPAALLLPLLRHLWDGIQTFDDYDWRDRGLDDALVDFLRVCWEKRRVEVSTDDTYRRPFLAILAAVTSRGNHAAAAFNALVVEQIGNQA